MVLLYVLWGNDLICNCCKMDRKFPKPLASRLHCCQFAYLFKKRLEEASQPGEGVSMGFFSSSVGSSRDEYPSKALPPKGEATKDLAPASLQFAATMKSFRISFAQSLALRKAVNPSPNISALPWIKHEPTTAV